MIVTANVSSDIFSFSSVQYVLLSIAPPPSLKYDKLLEMGTKKFKRNHVLQSSDYSATTIAKVFLFCSWTQSTVSFHSV